VRVLDLSPETGGILHAKYFLVDGREGFVGSQNFDWRALEHIQEIGLSLREPAIVRGLSRIFEADWAVAGGGARSGFTAPSREPWRSSDGAIELATSPRGLIPDGGAWDLPGIVARIDRARRTILVQLLTYKARTRSGAPFGDLDEALRRAAGRGVSVRLMVSSWGAREESLRSLGGVANVTVSVMTIPPWSGGEIPFARVAHAKYMVVDGEDAWVGTSNWEGDYFLASRNVSIFVRHPAVCERLTRVFEDGWRAYARPLVAGTAAPSPDGSAP
jgi:phosphatidylserine/phosphatidylglycerophosphate/cardiolipin synthase-like enzyme